MLTTTVNPIARDVILKIVRYSILAGASAIGLMILNKIAGLITYRLVSAKQTANSGDASNRPAQFLPALEEEP